MYINFAIFNPRKESSVKENRGSNFTKEHTSKPCFGEEEEEGEPKPNKEGEEAKTSEQVGGLNKGGPSPSNPKKVVLLIC